MVKLSTKHAKHEGSQDFQTLVSNDKDNEWDKLYLRVNKKKGKIKVSVRKNHNVSQVVNYSNNITL